MARADLNHITIPSRHPVAPRGRLSLMIRDPFVRDAFRRAEDDGLAPLVVAVDRPSNFNGGATAALEECGR